MLYITPHTHCHHFYLPPSYFFTKQLFQQCLTDLHASDVVVVEARQVSGRGCSVPVGNAEFGEPRAATNFDVAVPV